MCELLPSSVRRNHLNTALKRIQTVQLISVPSYNSSCSSSPAILLPFMMLLGQHRAPVVRKDWKHLTATTRKRRIRKREDWQNKWNKKHINEWKIGGMETTHYVQQYLHQWHNLQFQEDNSTIRNKDLS